MSRAFPSVRPKTIFESSWGRLKAIWLRDQSATFETSGPYLSPRGSRHPRIEVKVPKYIWVPWLSDIDPKGGLSFDNYPYTIPAVALVALYRDSPLACSASVHNFEQNPGSAGSDQPAMVYLVHPHFPSGASLREGRLQNQGLRSHKWGWSQLWLRVEYGGIRKPRRKLVLSLVSMSAITTR